MAYDPTAKRLFVSDDDTKRIWEIASAGADGLFGTADDGPRTLRFKSSDFGNTDTEDIAYDSKRKQLLLVDGVQEELFRVDPGPDGVFNGIAPAGDDVMTHSDLRMLGVRDPEGLTYDGACVVLPRAPGLGHRRGGRRHRPVGAGQQRFADERDRPVRHDGVRPGRSRDRARIDR